MLDFRYIQNFAFFALVFAVSIAFLFVIYPYFQPIFWALILAILFFPLNLFFENKFKISRTISSALVLFILILGLVLPVSVLGAVFLSELKSLYTNLDQYGQNIHELQDVLDRMPVRVDLNDLGQKLGQSITEYGRQIGDFAVGVGKTSIDFVIKFFIMLYSLFFFLRYGDVWAKRISDILPIGKKKEEYLFSVFAKMIRAVFKGSFVVAFVQGALGAILFAIAGIEAPIVWGAIMMILAFIPSLGPAIVWLPASIILFLLGQSASAFVVLFGGVFIISVVDNLLRPYLVGKGNSTPDLLIFLSVFGAIYHFGMSGIVIGPLIVALFLAVWSLFEKEYEKELKERG